MNKLPKRQAGSLLADMLLIALAIAAIELKIFSIAATHLAASVFEFI
jgi:hypothetical protein